MFLPFFSPDIDEAEINAVTEVLRSGILTGGIGGGLKVKDFEKALANYLGEMHVAAVSSCTEGMIIALKNLGVCPGDEVITSCLTFTATAEAIAAVGATPVIVDIDPATLNWNWEEVGAKFGWKTKALLLVHFAGLPIDMNKAKSIAGNRAVIVEDAAHALGSHCQGVPIGAHEFSTTVFSFYPNKPMTTGEGGAIVSAHLGFAEICRVARLHGIYRSHDALSWDYEVIMPGHKANMSEVAAAIGIAQLGKLTTGTKRRQEIASAYSQALRNLNVELPPQPAPGDGHSWHLYVLKLKGRNRNEFLRQMGELGIGTSVHYRPLCLHRYWQNEYGLREQDFPHACDYFERAVSLPIYPTMTDLDIERVIFACSMLLS